MLRKVIPVLFFFAIIGLKAQSPQMESWPPPLHFGTPITNSMPANPWYLITYCEEMWPPIAPGEKPIPPEYWGHIQAWSVKEKELILDSFDFGISQIGD